MKSQKLAEGKTKIIWQAERRSTEVIIESKDDLTAGDGARRVVLPGKAALANKTTCNVFRHLKHELDGRILITFLDQISDTEFRALQAKMIPIEIVVRRIATGSYIHRYREIADCTRLTRTVVEFFLKDDAAHDPVLAFDSLSGNFLAYDAHAPLFSTLPLRVFPSVDVGVVNAEDIPRLIDIASRIFFILEAAWAQQDVTLVDLKVECGLHNNEIILADVIDNDSWRIWPKGDPAQRKDKDLFRKLPEITDEGLGMVLEAYQWVADATSRF